MSYTYDNSNPIVTQGAPDLNYNVNEQTNQQKDKEQVKIQQPVSEYRTLGFGTSDWLGYVPGNRSNSDALALVDKISSVIKANHRPGFNFNVDLLDNINYELAYSCIVVSSQIGPKTYYATIVLESTGKPPLDAEEITKELQALARQPYNADKNIEAAIRTATPQDANDANLHNVIRNYLSTKYGAKKYGNVNGLVLPNFELDIDNVGYNLANITTKSILVENLIIDKDNSDVNIRTAIEQTKGRMEYEINYQSNNMFNAVGNPIRTDFLLKLGVFAKIDPVERRSINVMGKGKLIVEVGGYVDFIPEEVTINVPGSPTPITKTVLKPNIIGTLLAAQEPTPSNLLLCIASLKVMADKNMYIPSLNIHDPKTNVGNLNIYTNLNNTPLTQGQHAERLDLSSSELSTEDVYQILGDMFTQHPSISVDIEAFGPDSYLASILYDAASGASKTSVSAAKDLIAAAAILTDGHFPTDFPHDRIFIGPGNILPSGYIVSKSDIIDLRTIDLAYFAGAIDEDRLLNDFVISNLPYEVSGDDSYTKRIELISKVAPRTKISGKIARVTFTAEFLNELDNAIRAAGLVTTYKPSIVLSSGSRLANFRGYFGSGEIQNTSNFANAFTNVRGSGISTGWGSGFYRQH